MRVSSRLVFLIVFPVAFSTAALALDSAYDKLLNQADKLIEKKRYLDAVSSADKAMALSPGDGRAYFKRAYAWMKQGDDEQALDDFQKAKALGVKHSSLNKCIGNCALRCSQYELALQSLTEALKSNRDMAELYMRRSECYRDMKRNDLRLKDLNCAIALERKNAYNLRERAKCYEAMGQTRKALIDYDASIDANPLDTTYELRGDCRQRLGLLAEAACDYGRAIKKRPERAGYYVKRAALYRKLGETQKALADEMKVTELGEDFAIPVGR